MLLLLLACSDYQVVKEEEHTGGAPIGDPDIEVTPTAVDLGVLCASAQSEVRASNVGEGPLTITGISVTGDGWALQEVPLPITLEPGESTALVLTASGGDGDVVIISDDPDEGELHIPLAGQANAAPSVTILSPSGGDVWAEGLDVTLSGQVSDDMDSPDALSISWSVDTIGVLSTDPASADGSTSVGWAAADRGTGPQTITLTATDSCGLSTSQIVAVCQDGAYTYEELSLTTWHFEGASTWDSANNWLELTQPLVDQVGTAFETSRTVDGGTVDIEFLFYVGGGSGADGMSLTALDTSRMTTYLGGSGCGIGYGGDAVCTAGPALPGWSLEIDTYQNADAGDPYEDHLAFTFDGDVGNPATVVTVPELEDTGWHSMYVSVTAPHVLVMIDGVTYIDADFSGNFSFPAYVGFTAGTGSLTNYHLVDSLAVTDYYCE